MRVQEEEGPRPAEEHSHRQDRRDHGWGDAGLTRAQVALRALDDVAVTDSVYVELLLEAVAELARGHTVPAVLPNAEREVWASVGARFDNGTVAHAQARAARAFAELLSSSAAGDAAAAKILGVDRSRVSQKVSERSLFAVPSGGERYYPRWQFVDGRPLRGLKAVLGALDKGLHPLTVKHWFTTSNRELDVDGNPLSPVAWLITGGAADVAARLAAEV